MSSIDVLVLWVDCGHRCVKENDEDPESYEGPCTYYKKCYESLCPTEWVSVARVYSPCLPVLKTYADPPRIGTVILTL